MEVVFSSSQELSPAAKIKIVGGSSSFASWAGLAAESLFATLFRSDCRLCGTPLIKVSRLPVCEDCLLAMRPIAGGVCSSCGEGLVSRNAFSEDHNEPRCGLCRRLAPPFAKAAAYGSYDGGLRELIHLLKYERMQSAAEPLGGLLARVVERLSEGDAPMGRDAVVVAVPLYPAKQRRRGYNQSVLLADVALRDLRRVAHTMKLEAQETGNADLESRIEAYIRDVLKDRDLWSGP